MADTTEKTWDDLTVNEARFLIALKELREMLPKRKGFTKDQVFVYIVHNDLEKLDKDELLIRSCQSYQD